MICLSFEQIIELHDTLIEKFGGLHGIGDRGLLESALAAPMIKKNCINLFITKQ